jgi:hypothetical protein
MRVSLEAQEGAGARCADEVEALLMLTMATLIYPKARRIEAGGLTVPAKEVYLPWESSVGTSSQGSTVEVISSSA